MGRGDVRARAAREDIARRTLTSLRPAPSRSPTGRCAGRSLAGTGRATSSSPRTATGRRNPTRPSSASSRCDGLVCTNPEYFERNRERYRCALIPNGVDLDRFHPGPAERERFGLPRTGPIVLMVSALIASKNVAEGIAAVARVPGATLVVAGDGPLRDELHKLAGELLPGRFLQLTVPAPDMPALYRSADAFMHLSLDESFGNVFVEAMATGLPIVAFERRRPAGSSAARVFGPVGAVGGTSAQQLPLRAPWRGARRRKRSSGRKFRLDHIGRRYEDFFADVLV